VWAQPHRGHGEHDAHREGDRREQQQAGLSGGQQVREFVHTPTTLLGPDRVDACAKAGIAKVGELLK